MPDEPLTTEPAVHRPVAAADADRPPPRYLRAKGEAMRLWLLAKGLWQATLSYAPWVLTLLFFVALAHEIVSDQTEIQPISVPRTLADGGYTPEVAARRLQDRMMTLDARAWASGMGATKFGMRGDAPDIVVPTVGMSLSGLAAFIRRSLPWWQRRTISGELTEEPQGLRLVLRFNGRGIHRSAEPVPRERLDEIWQPAATAVLTEMKPIRAALLTYDSNQAEGLRLADAIRQSHPESDANVFWAHIIRGQHHINYGQHDIARTHIDAALRLVTPLDDIAFLTISPEATRVAAVAHFYSAQLHWILGQHDDAMSSIAWAIALDRSDPGAQHIRGLIARDLGRSAAQADAFARTRELLQRQIADAHAASRSGAERVPIYLSLANALSQQGDHEGAIRQFEHAITIGPEYTTAHSDFCAALRNVATSKGDHGVLERAEKECWHAVTLAPRNVFAHRALAEVLLERYRLQVNSSRESAPRFRALLAAIDRAIELDPQYGEMHSLRGDAFFHKGDFTEALAAYEAAIARADRSMLHHANRIAALAKLERPHEADRAFHTAEGLQPDNAARRKELGDWLFLKGSYPLALQAYEAATARSPMSAQYHASQGGVLLKLGKFPKAVASYQEAVRLDPDNAEHRNALGVAFFENKNDPSALAAYEAAIARSPGGAVYHVNKAGALQRLGRFPEAVASYQKAIDLDPYNAEPRNALGDAFLEKQDYSSALAAYESAIARSPRVAMYHANRGAALRGLAQHLAVVESYQAAVRLDPDNAAHRFELGFAFSEVGNFERAVAAYDEAIHRAPNVAVYHATRTMALLQLSRIDDAIQSVEKARALEPNNDMYVNLLGAALARKGNSSAALDAFDKAIALAPRVAQYHANRAAALDKLGRLADAVSSSKEARGLEPDNAERHCRLGIALAALGQSETGTARLAEAVAAFDDCLARADKVWPAEQVEAVRKSRDAARTEIARRSAR